MSITFKSNFKVQDKEMISLSVYNVGFQKCGALHQWGPGVRNHYLIHYVVSGHGYYKVDGKTYYLCAGDSFLVYPNTEVLYYADAKNPWEYYWVGFSGADVSTILKSTDFSKESPVISQISNGDAVKKQLLHIYEARGNDVEHSVEMTGRLYTTLAIFIKGSTSTHLRKNSYSTYAQKGVEYISSRYSYPITVEDVADYVGISRSHLYRAFKEHLSISPKEYLSEYRIRQACILLKRSSLSITAISKSVGFESNLYFSKAFRNIKGVTPSNYAKKHKVTS